MNLVKEYKEQVEATTNDVRVSFQEVLSSAIKFPNWWNDNNEVWKAPINVYMFKYHKLLILLFRDNDK